MSICLTILPKAVNSPYDAIQPAYKFFPFSAFGFHYINEFTLGIFIIKKKQTSLILDLLETKKESWELSVPPQVLLSEVLSALLGEL